MGMGMAMATLHDVPVGVHLHAVCTPQQLAGHFKYLLLLITAFGTLAVSLLLMLTYAQNGVTSPCRDHSEPPHTELGPWSHIRLTAPLVRVFVAMLGEVVVEFYNASADLRLVSWLGVLNWQAQVAYTHQVIVECRDSESAATTSSKGWVLSACTSIWTASTAILVICLVCRVVYCRWLQLEIMSGGQSREGWRRCLLWSVGLTLLILALFAGATAVPDLPHLRYRIIAPVFVFLLPGIMVPFVSLAWPNIRLALSASRAASKAALPGRAQRVRQAASSVLLQFVTVLVATGSAAPHALLLLWDLHVDDWVAWLLPGRELAGFVDVFCNTLLLLASAGILTGAGRSARLRSRAARARQKRWRRNWEAWHQRGQEKDKAVSQQLQWQWDEKVRELAGRGISLDALLHFYRQTLPGVMPHFDPQNHTTGNVVFEAVIPYTSKEGCAAADLMMAGKFTLPHIMVTHNWNNKFAHLIAAIVSEAIGESDFGMVAWLLVHHPDRLEAWIADCKVGSRVYWVCAFAVNQHISVCGGRGRICGCKQQKLLNDSPPLMANGTSIPCEVNKFDDVMRYLSAKNPTFEQLVAVDTKCDLFWRAWCMAEIATAREIGMPQTLKVTSPDCLEANLEKLSQLRIEDMHASRQEDKELILSRIESPEDFNATLRHTLLNEVIPAWSSLDASEQMSLAGCIIRWQRLSQHIGDPAMWAA